MALRSCMVVLALVATGCSSDDRGDVLLGTWEFRSADPDVVGEVFEISLSRDEDDLFGADIRTDCGLDGLLLSDWTDIEVTLAPPSRDAPEDQVSGSLSFVCAHEVHPFGGQGTYFEGYFVGGIMTGRSTYTRSRGNKRIGYYPIERHWELWFARRLAG